MEEGGEFTEISEEEFYGKYRFSFGAMLDLEVLNRDYRTFCFVNPFELMADGKRAEGESFADLFRLTGNEGAPVTFPNLLAIRKQFTISKRSHPIRPAIAAALSEMGASGRVFVRRSRNFTAIYWSGGLARYFSQDDWIACLPESEGEFQIFDEDCSWLVNARDDDFLNFLIVPNERAGVLETLPPGFFIEVTR